MAFERFGKEHIALTKVIERYFGADAGYLDISCLDVARVILEAGWTKQEWISVKDRLPENDAYINATTDGIVVPAYWHNDRFYAFTAIGVATVGGVTHWMPLPQPPKGE